MALNKRVLVMIINFASMIVLLSCSFMELTDRQNSISKETKIAEGILATQSAEQKMTMDAGQAQQPGQPSGNLQSTYTPYPTFTPYPTYTNEPPQQPQQPVQNDPPTAEPSKTETTPPQDLVLEINKSVSTFYCYQAPYNLTITVRVSDINQGMAVYYHIEDKVSGVKSDPQVVDLHRKSSDTRDATIIGGNSSAQNLQFPPMMGESYFVYQIISDDVSYRSKVYSDITYYPCAQ